EITPEIEHLAGGAGSSFGTGGMSTKIQAAKICTSSGIPMVIASGTQEGVLHDILAGREVGTVFLPRADKLRGKKKWIAYGSAASGKIVIDAGAAQALTAEGKSLLPVGIVAVEGQFEAGSVVRVYDPTGKEVAR